MSPLVRYLLAAGPLSAYFFLLALWQGGRHPRVIGGFWDAFLLAAGIGGLVAFGPLGHWIVLSLFHRPQLLDWLAVVAVELMLASVLAQRSWRRIVIYHIEPDALDEILTEALAQTSARFDRTVHGFQDRRSDNRIDVELQPVLRTAQVRVSGGDAARLVPELIRRLRDQVPGVHARPTVLAGIFAGLSALALVLPFASYLLAQPEARNAVRGLLRHLHGG